MVDVHRVLAASAACARWLTVGVPALLIALWLRGRRTPAAARGPLALDPRAERLAMFGIVAYVLVTRLALLDAEAQPRWYFTQVGPLYIAEALRQGDWGRQWIALLGNVQVIWEYQSAIMAPVAAVAQLALGPSPSLPGIIGAWWSLLAVLAAWRLGRSVESPVFGVLFAGLVAVSPLQLTWARLGGIAVGAPVHVLAVLWAGWAVGRRSGVLGALLLGVLTWTSVYQYFAARVGLVLSPVALWAGWRVDRRGAARLAALTAAFALALGACIALHHTVVPQQSLWPDYRGYAGNRGETTARQLLASAVTDIRSNLGRTVGVYAWRDRMGPLSASLTGVSTPWTGTALQADLTGGGLALVPVLALGGLGLIVCLRYPITRGLWLAFAGVALLPIVLAVPTARRLLVFDVAWCAFAAFGLSALLGSRIMDGTGARTRGWLAAGVIGALGAWTAAAIAFGDASLPPFRTLMPFAESGFGDGRTCLACAMSARAWRREIEDGRMVVLFDTDVEREDRTVPGGLWAYGKLAGLSAGRPDAFLDFYALLSNFDVEPPRVGPIVPKPIDDAAGALAERIEAAAPDAIVWWFSQPNAWERALADALGAAGSTRSEPGLPPTALSDRPGAQGTRAVRVETPWERREEALHAVRELLAVGPVRPCVRLEVLTKVDFRQPPLAITPLHAPDRATPDWAMAGWHEVVVGTARLPLVGVAGLDTSHAADRSLLIHLLDFWGVRRAWPVGGQPQREGSMAPRPIRVGRDCAARQRGEWWVADPIAGSLAPVDGAVAVPLTGVMGVASHGDDLLVATAGQRLHVVDPKRGEVRRSFPATIVPTRRTHYGECAMLATGDGWIAALDQMRGLLAVYDEAGRPLGRLPLAQTLGTSPMALQAIRGTGDLLGVGHDLGVTTLRLVPEPACTRGAP